MSRRRELKKLGIAVLAAMMIALPAAMVSGEVGGKSADEVSRITRQVSQELYSPYCPGQTLAMCPSSNASETRRDIQGMAEEGMGVDEIKQELLTRYGAGYEMVEPSQGDQRGLLMGILGGLVVAVLAVGVMARRQLSSDEEGQMMQDGDEEAEKESDDMDDLYLEELRAEVED